jgi:hypothetical protein
VRAMFQSPNESRGHDRIIGFWNRKAVSGMSGTG